MYISDHMLSIHGTEYPFATYICWGYPKIRKGSPNTREKTVNTFKHSDDARGDKESPKDCSNLKSCESCYTCPRAPFIGRTCTRMSFTSHTFTSQPLVHTLNPEFLRRRLWLCFLLVRESPRSGNLRASWLPNLTSSRLPNSTDSRFHSFAGSWLRVFMSSRLRSFASSRFQIIARSRLRGFASSRLQIFARSRLWGFAGSRF
jgi:hypothetical protein